MRYIEQTFSSGKACKAVWRFLRVYNRVSVGERWRNMDKTAKNSHLERAKSTELSNCASASCTTSGHHHYKLSVRLATEREILAIAYRSGSAGAWLVEAEMITKGRPRLGGPARWSSHLSEDAAIKAAQKSVRKLIKNGHTAEFIDASQTTATKASQ